MPDQQNVVKLLLTAGGSVLFIIVAMKFHKNILQYFSLKSLKNIWLSNLLSRSHAAALKVKTINDEATCKEVIAELKVDLSETWPVCGFDCEWVTVAGQRHKVALIQLSSRSLCALIRVCKFPNNIPIELKKFLEDPEVVKVGVTPLTDAKFLYQDYGIDVKSTLDLRFLALLTKPSYTGGLAKLSKAVLDIELDKDWRLVCSDWESDKLTARQSNYASLDAFVAAELFSKLYNSLQETLNKDHKDIKTFCNFYLDKAFKNKAALSYVDQATNGDKKSLLKENDGVSKDFKRSYATRSSPLYHNCFLQAPDGELLCTLDRKKAEWYVKNNLGAEVETEPNYVVRLNFEPSGRARGAVGDYYRVIKENQCVVCGRTKDLVRKNVVPHEYRTFFPLVMKSKTSHDIVLLCMPCHQQSNIKDQNMRKSLEAEYNAPIKEIISSENMDAIKIQGKELRTARALLKEKNIPDWRKKELEEHLKKTYPNQKITEDFLQVLLSKDKEKPKNSSASHAKIVVDAFKEKECLIELEKRWRQHFITSMEPKYLPELWDINHNSNRLEIRASEGRVNAEDLKLAGVNAVIVPKQSKVPVNQPEQIDDSSSNSHNSDWEYCSAISSRNSNSTIDLDATLTGDDRYFSDITSNQSFYETVRSDGSTLDDFQSFASSLTERPDFDSDFSQRSSLSNDSDTEVEDHLGNMDK